MKNNKGNAVPEALQKIDYSTMRSFLESLSRLSGGMVCSDHFDAAGIANMIACRGGTIHYDGIPSYKANCLLFQAVKDQKYQDDHQWAANLLWFDQRGQAWVQTVAAVMNPEEGHCTVKSLQPCESGWQKLAKGKLYPFYHPKSLALSGRGISPDTKFLLNSSDELRMILLSADPDAYRCLRHTKKSTNNGLFTPASFLMAPQLMKLQKWNYAALSENYGKERLEESDYEAFRTYTRPGNTEDEVFTLPPEIREKIKPHLFARTWKAEFETDDTKARFIR